jgi:hypothetical protein
MHTEMPLDRGLTRAQRPMSIGVITSHPWLLALLASLPIGWLVACYFLGAPPGIRATGFIQYDQAYYMAEAREHWDGGFHLLYGLPASPDIDTPRVYFRPQTLFLGTLGKLTNVEPGWIYAAFGFVATVVFSGSPSRCTEPSSDCAAPQNVSSSPFSYGEAASPSYAASCSN